MAQILLNLEIGEKFVNVCVSSGNGKNFKITKQFRFEHFGNVVTDGVPTNPSYLADQIKQSLNQYGISDVRRANFVFNSTKVVSREVSIPVVKENKIAEVISLNASEYFPVDITNFHITHTLLEKISGENASLRLMLTAVPKNIVVAYFELAQALKVSVNAIDYAPNGQYQMLKSIKDDEVVLYLNVNLKTTTATFMNNGNLMLQRNLPFGADEIVSAVLRDNELEEEEYMKTYEQCMKEKWLEMALDSGQLSIAMSRITGGIGRSLEFFSSSQRGLTVDKIVLMGMGARIWGLKEAISQSIPCEILETIPQYSKAISGMSDFINCVSTLGALVSPLNLLQDDLVRQNRKISGASSSDSLLTSILILIFAVVAGGTLSLTAFFDYAREQNDLNDLNMEHLELQANQPIHDEYVLYSQMYSDVMGFVSLSDNENKNLVAFLEELEEKVPSNLVALSASCTAENITINVTVGSFEEAAVAMANIRSFETIDNILVSGITEEVNDAGQTSASFAISCQYKVPEIVEEVVVEDPTIQTP